MVAANGDMLFTTIVAQGTPDPDTPGVQRIVEIHTITGGTGRFAGAQGSFTVIRLVEGATGVTSGSFEGTITSPGAGKKRTLDPRGEDERRPIFQPRRFSRLFKWLAGLALSFVFPSAERQNCRGVGQPAASLECS